LERTALGGHRAVVRCDATGANFGEDVVAFSFGMHAIGCAMIAEPPMACSNVEVFILLNNLKYLIRFKLCEETRIECHHPVHC